MKRKEKKTFNLYIYESCLFTRKHIPHFTLFPQKEEKYKALTTHHLIKVSILNVIKKRKIQIQHLKNKK